MVKFGRQYHIGKKTQEPRMDLANLVEAFALIMLPGSSVRTNKVSADHFECRAFHLWKHNIISKKSLSFLSLQKKENLPSIRSAYPLYKLSSLMPLSTHRQRTQ